LLFAVTLVACGLGYPLHWIQQRHAFIESIEPTGVMVLDNATVDPPLYDNPIPFEQAGSRHVAILRNSPEQVAPWPLRWLGEPGHVLILLRLNAPDSELKRVQSLFPEAVVGRSEWLSE